MPAFSEMKAGEVTLEITLISRVPVISSNRFPCEQAPCDLMSYCLPLARGTGLRKGVSDARQPKPAPARRKLMAIFDREVKKGGNDNCRLHLWKLQMSHLSTVSTSQDRSATTLAPHRCCIRYLFELYLLPMGWR